MNSTPNITLANSGINVTDAYINYNLTVDDLENVLSNVNTSKSPLLAESDEGVNLAQNTSMKEIEEAKKYPIVKIWISVMENATHDFFNKTTCSSFRDCLLVSFSKLYELYDGINLPNADIIQGLIPEIEDRFLAIIKNGSLSLDKAVDLSGDVLKMLKTTKSTKVFCADPPVFAAVPDNITILVNENAELYCNATGDPSPTFTWLDDDDEPIPNATEPFLNVTSNTTGNRFYTCIATNHVANLTSEPTFVKVEEPPKILSNPSSKIGIEGIGSVVFSCEVQGDPKPTVDWYKLRNQEEVPTNGYDNIFTLNATASEDEGFYRCKANNKHGVASSEFASLTLRKPHIAVYRAVLKIGFLPIQALVYSIANKISQNEILYEAKENETFEDKMKNALFNLYEQMDNVTFNIIHIPNNASETFAIIALASSSNNSEFENATSLAKNKQEFDHRKSFIIQLVQMVEEKVHKEVVLFEHGDFVFLLDRSTFDVDWFVTCEDGYEIHGNHTFICIECMPHTFYNSSLHDVPKCQSCPPGTEQPMRGQHSCVNITKESPSDIKDSQQLSSSLTSSSESTSFDPDMESSLVGTSTAALYSETVLKAISTIDPSNSDLHSPNTARHTKEISKDGDTIHLVVSTPLYQTMDVEYPDAISTTITEHTSKSANKFYTAVDSFTQLPTQSVTTGEVKSKEQMQDTQRSTQLTTQSTSTGGIESIIESKEQMQDTQHSTQMSTHSISAGAIEWEEQMQHTEGSVDETSDVEIKIALPIASVMVVAITGAVVYLVVKWKLKKLPNSVVPEPQPEPEPDLTDIPDSAEDIPDSGMPLEGKKYLPRPYYV